MASWWAGAGATPSADAYVEGDAQGTWPVLGLAAAALGQRVAATGGRFPKRSWEFRVMEVSSWFFFHLLKNRGDMDTP